MDNGAIYYRRYLDGDEQAFDELIRLYYDGLIFFIQRTVHDQMLAEDLAEDCFVELIVHPHRYNFRTPLKTYLYAIAHHKSVDAVRKKIRRRTDPLEECTDLPPDTSPTPEQALLFSERDKALHRALEQLHAEYREVLHLLYFEELSYEDAARVMRKNKKQIENLAYRGRKALRTELEKGGFTDEGL